MRKRISTQNVFDKLKWQMFAGYMQTNKIKQNKRQHQQQQQKYKQKE